MHFIIDFLKQLFPQFTNALSDAFRAARKSRRRRQHIFILNALMADEFRRVEVIPLNEMQIESVMRRVTVAQMREAGAEAAANNLAMFGELPERERQEFSKQLKKVCKKYGLPTLHDHQRQAKVEEILHDMVEDGKLIYVPPRKWRLL